jgi:putative nucleotidyltransferase with HDIG domain
MKQNGILSLQVLAGFLVFILALNPLAMEAKWVFAFVCGLVVLLSHMKSWINGVFISVFSVFIFYSINGLKTGEFVFYLVFMSLLSVLADFSRKIRKDAAVKNTDSEEKEFVNKVVNSLMLAHDMLREIKADTNSMAVRKVLSRNIESIMGIRHIQVYAADQAKEGAMISVFSHGEMHGVINDKIEEAAVKGLFLKNLDAHATGFIENAEGLYAVIVPVYDENKLREITMAVREKPFREIDVYILEFFSEQVFIIMEKHALISKLKGNYEKVIQALAIAIDTKDHETHGHSMATMTYAIRLAEKLGLPEKEKEKIRYASLLHDIGKINISSSILNKPSSLTDEEFGIIKKHPKEGVTILNKLDIFDEILPIILYHHEHFDGRGYPSQLKGEEIPLGARICSIADAYSVMRSDRPYRKALTKDAAVNELKKCSGSQFDSKLVGKFLEIIEEENGAPAGSQLN